MKTAYSNTKKNIFLGILFIAFAALWTISTESKIFDIIAKIRLAITVGDSGHLIIASILNCLIFTVPLTCLYIGMEFLCVVLIKKFKISDAVHNFWFIWIFMSIYSLSSISILSSAETINTLIALIIILFLVYLTKHNYDSMIPKMIISFQVFFFMQWVNVMPFFTPFHFGYGDISISIKIASNYLENSSTMNSIGISFILPLFLSSIMTSFIFRIYAQNIQIVKENYDKALSIENMENKIMENKIYQELNALAHDLKTPLSTIQGLSSLMAMTKDISKIENYTGRIDQAIGKMTEMISSFLYGTSRQTIKISNLISYIRAQIPVENEHIKFKTDIEENIPPVYVNKIRIARALVNLIENAILAPNSRPEKTIEMKISSHFEFVRIKISDNGMGISDQDIDKIWIIGYSKNNTTGLGLPFAKQTIDENNGRINLQTTYGKGTTVIVDLPISDKKEDNNVT